MNKTLSEKQEITNSRIVELETRREKLIANGVNPDCSLIKHFDRRITALKDSLEIQIREPIGPQKQEEEGFNTLRIQQNREVTNSRIVELETRRKKLIANGVNPDCALIKNFDRKITALKDHIDIQIREPIEPQKQEEDINPSAKTRKTNSRIDELKTKREIIIANGFSPNSALIGCYDRKIATLMALDMQISEQQSQIQKEYNLKYKSDWQQYLNILNNNNINVLYHFTDRANLQSIKSHGALYSWYYCVNNNITIPMQGGDDLSRSLDCRYNLQNYVRVSFTRNHPMMYIALDQNRIKDPIILEIDKEVIFWESVKYADRNATRNDVNIGSEIDDFKKIRFDLVKFNKYFDLDDTDKPYFQAEILILEKIPIKFIKNIDLV